MNTRRQFIKLSGLGLAGAATGKIEFPGKKVRSRINNTEVPFELGIASYTFRKFNLEDTLVMTNRVGIKNIAFKDFHLPLTATEDDIIKTVEKVKQAGINLYGGGVIYMNDEAAVNQAFENAKMAGLKVIIR